MISKLLFNAICHTIITSAMEVNRDICSFLVKGYASPLILLFLFFPKNSGKCTGQEGISLCLVNAPNKVQFSLSLLVFDGSASH